MSNADGKDFCTSCKRYTYHNSAKRSKGLICTICGKIVYEDLNVKKV